MEDGHLGSRLGELGPPRSKLSWAATSVCYNKYTILCDFINIHCALLSGMARDFNHVIKGSFFRGS